jgi:hypothetical protein
MCKHWKEIDDEHGREVEYCRSLHKSVSCCAELKYCHDISKYEEYTYENKKKTQ